MTMLLTTLILLMILGICFATVTVFGRTPINEDGYRTFQFNVGAGIFVFAYMLLAGVVLYV